MYDDKTFYSRAAVIEHAKKDIRRAVVVDEIARTRTTLAFTHPLFKLMDTCTTSVMKIGDDVIREGATHNDFYGFFTSFTEVLAGEMCNPKLTGPVYGEVWITIETQYAAAEPPSDMSFGGTKYRVMPKDWIVLDGQGRNTEEGVEKWVTTPFPESVEIRPRIGHDTFPPERVLLWTSRDTPAQNRQRFQNIVTDFKDRGAYSEEDALAKIADYDKNVAELSTTPA